MLFLEAVQNIFGGLDVHFVIQIIFFNFCVSQIFTMSQEQRNSNIQFLTADDLF